MRFQPSRDDVRRRVEITAPAETNIEESHDWLYAESAKQWFAGLMACMGQSKVWRSFPDAARWLRRAPIIPKASGNSGMVATGFCSSSENRQCLWFTSGTLRGTEPGTEDLYQD
jgi:hypothetical protein